MIAKSVSFLMRQGVFFGEAMPLAEERTHRYGQKKQHRIIKKVAFAAQSLASKHTLRKKAYRQSSIHTHYPNQSLIMQTCVSLG